MQMESTEPEGKVIEVLAKGYAQNGRVLRPARVVVAKKSAAEKSAEESMPE
jgi:molecular chaperone GrpE (heat shock protein)